jgi:hypothetical protein
LDQHPLTARPDETEQKELPMSSSRHWSRRKNLDVRRRAPAWRKRDSVQLIFENLETRWLMANFSVINTNDSGAGSLRQAIR